MFKYLPIFVASLAILGCGEKPCPCQCGDCGVECRNRCEADRCILGERCCETCDCPSKKPIKLPEAKLR